MRKVTSHIQTWKSKLRSVIKAFNSDESKTASWKIRDYTIWKKAAGRTLLSGWHSVSLMRKEFCWICWCLLSRHSLLPGATMISFFLERIRRNVRSFWGSMSRTVLLAFMMKLCMRPAYWIVVELSIVLLIGIPARNRGQQGSVT